MLLIRPDPAADKHSQLVYATASDLTLAHTANTTENLLTLA
jgi:hypothetical protein